MPDKLINAVLLTTLGMHKDASLVRYVGVVPWGVSDGAAQHARRRNAQRTYCDAQSERHHCHGGINCEL